MGFQYWQHGKMSFVLDNLAQCGLTSTRIQRTQIHTHIQCHFLKSIQYIYIYNRQERAQHFQNKIYAVKQTHAQ